MMGSQCEGTQRERKKGLRFLILALCFCVLLTGQPNPPVTVYASETDTEEADGTEATGDRKETVSDNSIEPGDTEAEDTEPGDTEVEDTEPGDTEAEDTEPGDTEAEDTEPEAAELSEAYSYSTQGLEQISPEAEPQSQAEAMWQAVKGEEWKTGSLAEAVGSVYAGGTVVLLSDVSLTGAIEITRNVVITSYSPTTPYTIANRIQDTDDRNSSGRIFTIKSGRVIFNDVILDGGGVVAYHPLICVTSGQVMLGTGVILQNAENASQSMCGGGVNVRGGQVFMDGAIITNCKAWTGGGVEVNSGFTHTSDRMSAAFVMTSGMIEKCEAGNGGGVYVNIGTFQMQNGTITGNRSTQENAGEEHSAAGNDHGGGGVYVNGVDANHIAEVTILNGSITGNHAKGNGGGVLVCGAAAKLGIKQGVFQDNSAKNGGGIAALQGTLLLYGGTVTGNIAESYGGGVLGCPYGRIFLQGEPQVYDNTAKDRSDHFDNLYLDGNEDINTGWATYPITLMGPLGENARIGLSRWIRPDEGGHPYREMFVPYGNYTIQQSDLDKLNIEGKLYADNMEKYAFVPREGEIVMVLAVSVALDKNRLSFEKAGETAALAAMVTPANALIKEVIWSSSDETVTTVDTGGVVTAVGEGKAVITVRTVSPYWKTAACEVTVGKKDDPEEGDDETKDPEEGEDNPKDSEEGEGDPKDPEERDDKPSDPNPPKAPDKSKEDKTPGDKENGKSGTDMTNEGDGSWTGESTVRYESLSEYKEPPVENARAGQEPGMAQNPQTGSRIVWLYAAAALSALCMLTLVCLRIKCKKGIREKE